MFRSWVWLVLLPVAWGGCSLGARSAGACEAGWGGHSVEIVRADAMDRYRAGDFPVFVNLMEAVVQVSDDDVDDYNLACGYALLGDAERAMERLNFLVDKGADFDFAQDADFATLRSRPDFQALADRVRFREEADVRLEPARELAFRYYDDGQYAAFVEVMEQVAHYSANSKDLYNLACGYALIGQRDRALEQLTVLAERGHDFGAASDADFAALQDDPRFRAVLDKLAHG